jgi:hypothetical protein
MKLTWKHTGPARETAIEVPDISIGNSGYALAYDPKRKCIVYVREKDYFVLEASTWNGTAWTRQKGTAHFEVEADERHGFYDASRGGVAVWSVQHDYDLDRIVPKGMLVTDGKLKAIKTKGDQPLIEHDSKETFFLSSNLGCAMAFDMARGVTVCVTRRGVWELDGAGVWSKRGEPSKHVPPAWHDDARGTWDPVGKRCVFWFQERGNGYKYWMAAWDGAAFTKISLKGLPNPCGDFLTAFVAFAGHHQHGVVAQLGADKGTWALGKDSWKRLPAKGDIPPRLTASTGNWLPQLAYDPDRDAIMIGPGRQEGAPGGSDAQRVFYELRDGMWRRLGAVQHRSPIEELSGSRFHAVVGDTWYATSRRSLHTMKWNGDAWKEVVDEKTGDKLVGKDSLGGIAATPEGLVGVTQKGAVFRLEKTGKYKQLAKASPTFKTRSDFHLAHDGTRLVCWGGEIKNRKANDTLTFDGKKWTAVKKSSPAPKWRTKEVDFIDFCVAFDSKLGKLVRFGWAEAAVLVGDEWKPFTPANYSTLVGARAWQHVPAHDPATGETLLVDFESGKVVRFDLAKCEEIAKLQYPADLRKIAEREHESIHYYFCEDAVFVPATRTIESQKAEDAHARHALDLGPVFAAASKKAARTLV